MAFVDDYSPINFVDLPNETTPIDAENLNKMDSQIKKLTTSGSAIDTELTDIRVGADGKTYPNAGDAVRKQVSSLKGDLDKYCGVSKPTYTLKENTYIYSEGYVSQVGFVTSNPIPVNANDIVKLTAKDIQQILS